MTIGDTEVPAYNRRRERHERWDWPSFGHSSQPNTPRYPHSERMKIAVCMNRNNDTKGEAPAIDSENVLSTRLSYSQTVVLSWPVLAISRVVRGFRLARARSRSWRPGGGRSPGRDRTCPRWR